jgi:hypothetical protein
MMVLDFFVGLFIYPETRGRSLETLQDQLGHEDSDTQIRDCRTEASFAAF